MIEKIIQELIKKGFKEVSDIPKDIAFADGNIYRRYSIRANYCCLHYFHSKTDGEEFYTTTFFTYDGKNIYDSESAYFDGPQFMITPDKKGLSVFKAIINSLVY